MALSSAASSLVYEEYRNVLPVTSIVIREQGMAAGMAPRQPTYGD
jgi:hypothetical protein